MTRRKGELSKAAIDSGWPHQVALRADQCVGAEYMTARRFCEGEGLSLCERGHSFRRDDRDYVVFCFAAREDAELFRQRFGGEITDPATRSRWSGRKQ